MNRTIGQLLFRASPPLIGIEALPDELLLRITRHLGYFDLLRLSRVSTQFLAIVYDASNTPRLFKDQLAPSTIAPHESELAAHPVFDRLSWDFTNSPNDGNPCYIGKHEIGSTPVFHMNATSPLVADLRLIINVTSNRGRGLSLEVPQVTSRDGVRVHHVLRAASDATLWNSKYWPATLKQWKGVEKVEYKNGRVSLFILIGLVIGGRRASINEEDISLMSGWDCVVV